MRWKGMEVYYLGRKAVIGRNGLCGDLKKIRKHVSRALSLEHHRLVYWAALVVKRSPVAD